LSSGFVLEREREGERENGELKLGFQREREVGGRKW
jgi:hypothetical protein